MREAEVSMRVTYDDKAGYVYLVGRDESAASAHQVLLDPACGYKGSDMIVLDFDTEWRLVGIEVLDANRSLPASVVEAVKSA